jgi:hypothetical protein
MIGVRRRVPPVRGKGEAHLLMMVVLVVGVSFPA